MKDIVLKKSGVVFDENAHRYFLDGKELRGITGTLVKWLFPDTYAAVPEAVLMAAAEHGHYVHSCIEMSDIVGATEDCPESQQYLDMMAEQGMSVVAHEYIVTDREHFASPIDLVLRDTEGGIWLADIKTTSQLHEPKVMLQLSVYAYLFELQNPGLTVKGIAEVWLPKPQYGKARWMTLQRADSDKVRETIGAYLEGKPYEEWLAPFVPETADLPAQYQDLIAQIAEQEQLAKQIKECTDNMKEQLLRAFRKFGVKKIDNEKMTISYVGETTRKTLDSKRIQDEYPEIYASCMKESVTKDSIRIKLK